MKRAKLPTPPQPTVQHCPRQLLIGRRHGPTIGDASCEFAVNGADHLGKLLEDYLTWPAKVAFMAQVAAESDRRAAEVRA